MKNIFLLKTFLALAVIAPLMGCGESGSSTNTTVKDGNLGAFVTLINSTRTDNGASTLTRDSELDAVAQAYAFVLENESESQYSSNADGTTVEDRLDSAGVIYIEAGDAGRIIRDYDLNTAYDEMLTVFQATIVKQNFTHVGVGFATWT